MADKTDEIESPIYYANFVTTQLNVDEMVMEFRRRLIPHRQGFAGQVGAPVVNVPPSTPAEILATEPIVRVVLTYSSAKSLWQFLDQAFPTAEIQRKQ